MADNTFTSPVSFATPYNGGSNSRGTFYPNKLFSLADMALPTNIKAIFKLCQYYGLTSEVIAPAIVKLAESPITTFLYQTSNETVEENYRKLFEEKLHIRQKLLRLSFDLFTYGNAFASVFQKPARYLVCPSCRKSKGKKSRFRVTDLEWQFERYEFKGTCPRCKSSVTFERHDQYPRNSVQNLEVVIWDPMRVELEHYDLLDKNIYFYSPSNDDRRKIRAGDRAYLSDIPWEYVEAVRDEKKIRLKSENLFHFYTQTISNAFPGWGIPRMLSVFKQLFYLATLQRANEATSIGRINDLVVVYPEMGRNGSDPLSSLGGGLWARQVQDIFRRHQADPNFVGISSAPLGVQSIFGNGRQMLVTPEMDMVIRGILGGMGVTMDMVFSASDYSSMAVATRMLANQLNLSRAKINEFLSFLARSVNAMHPSRFPATKVTLNEYETVDDLQETSFLMQLFSHPKGPRVSLDTILKRFKLSFKEEVEKIKQEQDEMEGLNASEVSGDAHNAGLANRINQLYIAQLQKMQRGLLSERDQSMFHPDSSPASAFDIAQEIIQLPAERQDVIFQGIQEENPQLASEVLQYLRQIMESTGDTPENGSMVHDGMGEMDILPQPDQKPPTRRGGQ